MLPLIASASSLGTAFLDLLYPPRCAACGQGLASTAEEPFCELCREALEPVPPGCARCGLPGPDVLCGGCLAAPPSFTSCQAGGLFGGPLAEAVHAFKYGRRAALARPLGRWLAGRVSIPPGAVLTAVPLGRKRRLVRGYDQAALLARSLAAALPRGAGRVLPGALLRIRETPPQVGRSREARLANVRGAFRASEAVRGRVVVLVDDVVTTGSTADACSRALLSSGAGSVSVVALARAG